jgi:anti-sigma B factor antagonist
MPLWSYNRRVPTSGPSKLQIAAHQSGAATVLVLSGQMTVDDGDLVFRKTVNELVTAGQVKLVLDLSGVDYIDSSGIGMLVEKVNTVRGRHGDIKLVRLTRRTQSLLATLKLAMVFETFDDEETAVRRYALERADK